MRVLLGIPGALPLPGGLRAPQSEATIDLNALTVTAAALSGVSPGRRA